MKKKHNPSYLSAIRFFFFLPVLLLIFIGSVSAQFNSYLGNFSHNPSPDASGAIAKNQISTDVDRYTGTVNIQIPLYTVSSGNLQVPITLFYRATGLKVEDIAGPVGLGWNLSAGGKITRIVKRFDDNKSEYGYLRVGYDTKEPKDVTDLSHWDVHNFEKRLENYDTEPDLFYFEYPGNSGMFVIDNKSLTIHTIPYQALDIRWVNRNAAGASGYFIIRDHKGTEYIFSEIETTSVTVKENGKSGNKNKTYTYTSTWYLWQIKNVNGESFIFNYVTEDPYEYSIYNSRVLVKYHDTPIRRPPFQVQDIKTINLDSKIRLEKPLVLSNIYHRNGKVKFIYKNPFNRQDIRIKNIDRIEVYNIQNQLLKMFRFDYSSFANKVLKLDRVRLSGTYQDIILGRFDYFTDENLPERSSFAFDHWGYYAHNTTYEFPHFTIESGQRYGIKRQAVLTRTRANTLKKITHSTGGSTEFEFELHQTTSSDQGGGLRIKRIKNHDPISGLNRIKRFEYTNKSGNPSGIGFNKNIEYAYPVSTQRVDTIYNGMNYYYNAIGYSLSRKPLRELFDQNGSAVAYSAVREIDESDGSSMYYEYTSQLDHPDIPCRLYDLDERRFTDSFRNFISPNTSQFWKRGLPKEITEYSSSGEEISKKIFNYNFKLPVRMEINALFPFYWGELQIINNMSLQRRFLSSYKWYSQPVCLESIHSSGKDVFSETVSYVYHPSFFVPTEIHTNTGNGLKLKKTTIKYLFQLYYNSLHTPESDAIMDLYQQGVRLVPIETIDYSGGKVIGGSLNTYRHFSSGKILPDKVYNLVLTSGISDYLSYDFSNGLEVDPRYKVVKYMDEYDEYGNLIKEHMPEGNFTYYKYGYNQSLPVAILETPWDVPVNNKLLFYESFEEPGSGGIFLYTAKTGEKVLKSSCYHLAESGFFPGDYQLSYWRSTDGKIWNKESRQLTVGPDGSLIVSISDDTSYIDEIRIHPVSARIKTRSWFPGVGLLSESDHNGVTTYYKYDQYRFLESIHDNDRLKVREYEYFLKNQ